MRLPVLFLLFLTCAACTSFPDTGGQAARAESEPYREEGVASWYGGKFQGRKTANGEIFDTNQLTAAHKTLPFGTVVRVLNTTNGRSVIVRINDRGPFIKGRIIDLSQAAAREIGMLGTGTATVVLTVESYGGYTGTFRIQVAAFGRKTNARNTLDDLQKKGIPARIDEGRDGIFRIVITGIGSEKLENMKAELRKAGYTNVMITRETAQS